VDEGLAEAVFQIEAEWQTPVVERLLEYSLSGAFEIQAENETRRVSLRGKADRIDLLADGTFRIIDYKLTRAPYLNQTPHTPIYTICTAQHLHETKGQVWEPGQAGYIAFGGDRRFGADARSREGQRGDARDAQTRLLTQSMRSSAGNFRHGRPTFTSARTARTSPCAARITWAMSDWLPFEGRSQKVMTPFVGFRDKGADSRFLLIPIRVTRSRTRACGRWILPTMSCSRPPPAPARPYWSSAPTVATRVDPQHPRHHVHPQSCR
jgi:hypothetical protein